MNHTNVNPMDSCSSGWRDPMIIPKSPPNSGNRSFLRMMMRSLGLFVFMFAMSFGLSAGNTPTTGSGASAILETYDFNGQEPNITDPCTCAGEVNGVEIFNDEIIVESFSNLDNWVLDVSASSGIFTPNSSTLIGNDIILPLAATGISPTGVTTYIYTLPIAHAAGVGYNAVLNGDAATMARYPGLGALTVANTCSKVDVDILTTFATPVMLLTPVATGTPTALNISLNILNQQSGGTITPDGEGQLYIGTETNPRKILVQDEINGNVTTPTSIILSLDPSGNLAIGGFDPTTDTLFTFVYDSGESAMSGMAGNFDANDPGCEAATSTSVYWDLCGLDTDGDGKGDGQQYSVGGSTQKYDGEKRTIIVCPSDLNKEVAQIAFTRFDIAAGDVLSIYEGVGTSGKRLDRVAGGGSSATAALKQTWFQADCENNTTGCLTVVFEPDANNNNNGTGFNFTHTCEFKIAEVTLPNDTIIAARCEFNNTALVANFHTVRDFANVTCKYDPKLGPGFSLDIRNTVTNGVIASNAKATEATLVATGDYLDTDGDGILDVGEKIFLEDGEYNICYNYMDLSVNANATMTAMKCYKVSVISSATPICNDHINVSLSNGCVAVLTPDDILEGNEDCMVSSSYEVKIVGGDRDGTDILDETYLGQTVKVEVHVVGDNANKCWGNVTIEDKLGPTITCPDKVVFCGQSTAPVNRDRTALDACTANVTFSFSDVETNFGCKPSTVFNRPDTIGLIVRTWTGTDANDNTSTCVQNVHILKPRIVLDDIIWPTDTTFYCGDNPSTDPASAGSPKIKVGNAIIDLDQTCFYGLNHEDQVFTTDGYCEGKQKIRRIWTILDWCRATPLTVGPAQLITVVDTVGPVFTNKPTIDDVVMRITGHECAVTVDIPAIGVSDACSSDDRITMKVTGPNGTIFTNGGRMSNVPFGTHDIIYIAEDNCGNTSRDTVQVTVKDEVVPTVICEQNLVVSLTQDGSAWAYASTFDDGTHDNCGVEVMQVRRMDICGQFGGGIVDIHALEFENAVPFDCCDIGSTVQVMLGVWDAAGNFNNCMVNVAVVDKVQPTLTVPADQTVTCSVNLDDLSTYGEATVTGGICSNLTLDPPAVVRNLNNCGAGFITRTWTIGDIVKEQKIFVELSTTNTFTITNLPKDEVTVQCGDVNLADYDNGDDLTYENGSCQVVAVNYKRADFLAETGACRKVVRTWEIIDWCVNPTASVDVDNDGVVGPGYMTHTQVVRVMDTEGPTIYKSNNIAVTSTAPSTYTFSVNPVTCSAVNLILPTFHAIDNCNATTLATTVSGEIGSETLTNATPGAIAGVTVGTYTLYYAAEDGCGNRAVHTVIIKVQDTVGPAMFCADELAVNLGSSLNATDLGGAIDIWATDFACKIEDCDGFEAGRVLVNYPANTGAHGNTPPGTSDDVVVFTCADIGRRDVDVWARDNSGNWSVVMVTVDVQDNQNLCTSGGTTGGGTTGGGTTGGGTTGGGTTGGGTTGGGTVCPVSFTAQAGEGHIAVTINSGPNPYTISWDGPVSSYYRIPSGNAYTISSLPAGVYTLTVTDANGCYSTQHNVTVSTTGGGTTGGTGGGTTGGGGNGNCTADFTVQAGNGQIAVTINSGPNPYTISWDGPMSSYYRIANGSSYTIPSLPAGVYSLTVTDANGCYSVKTDIVVTNTGGTSGGGTTDGGGNTNCPVSFTLTPGNGQIDVAITSGSQPYTISWDGPVSDYYRIQSGSTYTITSLPAGMYSITITDATGCYSYQTVMVDQGSGTGTTGGTGNGNGDTCPAEFTTDVGAGVIWVSIEGGTAPYTVGWDGPVSGFFRPNGNGYNITNLPIGVYTVIVTDANGCFSTEQLMVTSLTPPDDNGTCTVDFTATEGAGSISVTVNSGPEPYTIGWDGPVTGFHRINTNNYTIPDLPIGVYTIIVTDATGCYTTQTVMVNQMDTGGGTCPVDFIVNAGEGTIMVTVNSGPAPYTIGWDGPVTDFFRTPDGITSYVINALPVGSYTIIVTDADGCFSTENVSVVEESNTGGGDGSGEGDMAAIRGTIVNEEGESVENVTLNLGGYTMNPLVTGANGDFTFNSVPMYSNYTVTPEKNMNPLNGVSTFDLVLISKHILGIDLLDSSYKHIAADVNKSGTITAYDMVQLRQLILNISAEFPNNDSWRFVDASYEFTTNDAENEDFPEIAAINNLTSDMATDFVAVKIGDVSGNAVASNLATSEVRTANETMLFSVEDQTFEKGELVEVAFNLTDLENILGYQFTLNIDPTIAQLVELKEGVATEANFGLTFANRGQLTTSWNQTGSMLATEENMFRLVVRTNKAGRLSDILSINSEVTAKEAYTATGELMDVALDFGVQNEAFKLYQNTPNPFKETTSIGFDLPTSAAVQLSIFDVSGKLIKFVKGNFAKGYNEIQIEKTELSGNGIYFYNLETANYVAKKRMILID